MVNKFLLAGHKFMPEMHLKQPRFTYSACGSFTKNKERIKKIKETGDTRYIYKNELDKACFQHDLAYADFKELARITASDKVLRDKTFNIAKNPKYDGYQRELASMVYNFFDKRSKGGGVNLLLEPKEQLSRELRKPIVRHFKKGTIYSRFKDNIWCADLADMQLMGKFNKGFRFLLYVIDIFSKYARVVPLRDKNCITITNGFQKFLKESNRKQGHSEGRKPNKIWVDKGSEFYNSFKKWLKNNDIEMYSTNNEGKSVVAERVIRTLKTKIYKCMTSVSKKVCIDKVDDIVNEYNNTYHRTIKMKPVGVENNTCIDFKKEVNDAGPKFKVGDHVRIAKHKSIFAKGYTPNWSEENFVIKKVKDTVPWTNVINDLNGKEIIGTFSEQELQKIYQQEFRIEKVIKRKEHKLYVKWLDNSWIDRKDLA